MFDSQLSELKSQSGKLRRFAFLQNAIYWVEKTAIEALIGLLVAVVISLLIPVVQNWVYEGLKAAENTVGLASGFFTLDQIKGGAGHSFSCALIRILGTFTIKNTWLVLFGIRFVINYLAHGFDGFVSSK